jgi:hypothetical protein
MLTQGQNYITGKKNYVTNNEGEKYPYQYRKEHYC